MRNNGINWELVLAYLMTGKIRLNFLGLGFADENLVGNSTDKHINIENSSIFFIWVVMLITSELSRRIIPLQDPLTLPIRFYDGCMST